ncbi:Cytosolic Fe-S cluster assembly factor nar1 [Mycoemilia scoparia]|uniref:Cytosolic Fe-S cluster assembly factor nar1 n=1 Tax=Mycoemilia scoparia TaxID=417184 RepID=A0A9W7ZR51_9FUNG|nr:Cytosolic Fe-S cluster assembly factor nar1 [Mycoemilia scoparia]
MSFSGGVRLTDLNDFIAPSQECIKPVEVKKTSATKSTVEIGSDGGYYEVTKEGSATKLEEAQVTLNDCLACSGCVTSAETILIAMQSHEELISVLKANVLAKREQRNSDLRTVVVTISPQTRASIARKYNLTTTKAGMRLAKFLKTAGVDFVFDSAFSRDLSLMASAKEFVDLYRNRQVGSLSEQTFPILSSWCPGWICYAEKTHPEILPYISKVKSPQQIMGVLVKTYLAQSLGCSPDKIYHVSVMPCYDKKLEASRSDFYNDMYRTRDVDCVITTGEIERMIVEAGSSVQDLDEQSFDGQFCGQGDLNLARSAGSSAGGYLEYVMSYAASALFGMTIPADSIANPAGSGLKRTLVRNHPDHQEITLSHPQTGEQLLRFATVYGFRHLQNMVRKLKTGRCSYDYVEVAACPGACGNGGGQLRPPETSPKSLKEWANSVENTYKASEPCQTPEENLALAEVLSNWLPQGIDQPWPKKVLFTSYHAVQQATNGLGVKW